MTDLESFNSLENIVRVRTESDDMTAFVIFAGPLPGKATPGPVMGVLNDHGIRYGVDESLVNKAVNAFNDNMKDSMHIEFPVAKGLPMDPGENGYIEYLIEETAPVTIDKTGKADFRNIEKFRTVHPDQVLAIIHPARKGRDGYNVYGERISSPDVTQPRIQTGAGVEIDSINNEVRSLVTGIYSKIKNTISVSQVLEVNNNVGLETGNLEYEGVIKIFGNIERGAEVVAEGDLFVDGLVESGKIKTASSLHVSGGINTKNEDLIQVRDKLYAGYIDSSRIYCQGDVIVNSAIIAATMISCGNISLSKEGSKIVGGEVTAYGHIKTDNLGNMNETPTIINIGTHFHYKKLYDRIFKEHQQIEEQYKEAIEQIQSIKDYIQRMHSKLNDQKKLEFKKQFDQFKELEAKKEAIENKLNEVKEKRYYTGDVYLHVKNILHPGVTIHFFNHTEKINKEYKHCTLRFSKTDARFHLETYAPPEALSEVENNSYQEKK